MFKNFIITVLFFILASVSFAQTSLTAGDIAFVGVNSDGDDEFSAVFLKDIATGTKFRITDKGWTGSAFFSTLGDGIWEWTATGNYTAGTILNFKTTDNGIISAGSLIATPGSAAWIEGSGDAVISYTGDQFFLYQGTEASPVFIAGAHWNVETGSTISNWDGVANSNKTSALPTALSGNNCAIWLYGSGPTEYDNFMYNSANGSSGTPEEIRALVTNISNWFVDTSNATAYTIYPFNPTSFSVTAGATAPALTTTVASSITLNSAVAGGNITDDGGATITARGVCWNTTVNPTTSNPHTTETGTTGSFTSNITGLSPGILYHYRSYATNSEGTNYGVDLTFTTVPGSPANADISNDGSEVTVSWDAVIGATSYKVYSSTDPYTGFAEVSSGSYNGASWTGPFDGNMLFYYVVAVN